MTGIPSSAIMACKVPARCTTGYPSPFAERVAGRSKHALGDYFELSNFGVNLTRLAAGSQSSIRHRHLVQDEFVYVLDGEIVLIDDSGETALIPGMCAGFPHGRSAHHLVNRSGREAVYLEVGDRLPGDSAQYPDDDLVAERAANGWRFLHKSGEPY